MCHSQQPWEIVIDMQQFHGTGKDSERQAATTGDSERYAANPRDRRDNERQPAIIGDSERYKATPWN